MPRGLDRPICSVVDCTDQHKGHGFCRKHYQRWKKYGDPEHTERPCGRGMDLVDRVLNIGWTATEAGCHEWNGHRAKDGYGIIRADDGVRGQVHRLWFEAAHGELPREIKVCHTCDNPPCINLDHLFPGTSADNNHDRDRKGRTSRGEGHYAHKLTTSQVMDIRSRYIPKVVSQQALADEFGVSQQVISGIVRMKGWRL